MIVQVAPAKRLPVNLPFLDYLAPADLEDTLKIGQLVKIPFRNREEFGVVKKISSVASTNKKLKPITALVHPIPFISAPQLNFLDEMAEFYGTPLGFLIKSNLPPLQKRKLSKLPESDLPVLSEKKLAAPRPTAAVYGSPKERADYFKKNIAPGETTLIIVPELPQIDEIIAGLPAELAEAAVSISGELSNKEIFARWMQIWRGEKSIVVGTRRAFFLPYARLTHIFVDDEGNPNHKSWDMSPRFHGRDAARLLAFHHGAQLHLISHTLSVETYFFAKQKIYSLSASQTKTSSAPINLINLKDERRGGNYGFLSDELKQKITRPAGDIFIFVNRRGGSSVGCRDCGKILKCPSCQSTLIFHPDNSNLICHYCGYTQKMITVCDHCRGVNMALYGAGTQLVENEIKKIMPKNFTLARVDSDLADLERLAGDAPKIIVGTELVWAHLHWDKISLMVFLDIDSPLFIPEYKIAEDLWQLIGDARFRLRPGASLIIQTGHPDHLLFQSLNDPDAFYAGALLERQALRYPPYCFLLRLYAGRTTADASFGDANLLRARLSGLTQTAKDITIIGPLPMTPSYHHNLFWHALLVKINYEHYKEITKKIVKEVPASWKIDPNPNNILSF